MKSERKMLRSKDRNWIKTRKELKEKHAGARMKDLRLRQKILKTFEDLTFLAENLPEDQGSQVFRSEILLPFFDAIFNSPWKHSDEDYLVIDKRRFNIATEIGTKCLNEAVILINPKIKDLLSKGGVKMLPDKTDLDLAVLINSMLKRGKETL